MSEPTFLRESIHEDFRKSLLSQVITLPETNSLVNTIYTMVDFPASYVRLPECICLSFFFWVGSDEFFDFHKIGNQPLAFRGEDAWACFFEWGTWKCRG